MIQEFYITTDTEVVTMELTLNVQEGTGTTLTETIENLITQNRDLFPCSKTRLVMFKLRIFLRTKKLNGGSYIYIYIYIYTYQDIYQLL